MDVLSINLNNSNIGGDIGGQKLYHICYADNISLISPSSSGMQCLLNIMKQLCI